MMARRQYVLAAGGILAAFAAGLLLGRFIAPDTGSRDMPNSQPLVAAERPEAGPRRSFQERRADDAEAGPRPATSPDQHSRRPERADSCYDAAR